MSELQCPLCKRKLNDGDAFCSRCGRPGVPVTDASKAERVKRQKTGSGSRKAPIIACIVIAAAAVIAIIVIVVTHAVPNESGETGPSGLSQPSPASEADYMQSFVGDWTLESQPYAESGLRLASKGDMILRSDGTGYSEWMREPENNSWQISWEAMSATEAAVTLGNDGTYTFVLENGKLTGTQNGVEVTYVRGAAMNISSRSASTSQNANDSSTPTWEDTIAGALEEENKARRR